MLRRGVRYSSYRYSEFSKFIVLSLPNPIDMKKYLLYIREKINPSYCIIACIFILFNLSSLPSFGQRDDSAIAGKFTNTTPNSENNITIAWPSDLPYYDRGAAIACGGRYHKITIESFGFEQNTDEHRPGAGQTSSEMGPSRSGSILVEYEWGSGTGGCSAKWAYASISFSTSKIKAPTNLIYTVSASPTLATKLSWQKGTSISDDKINYQVLRDGAIIATLNGSTYNYDDSSITPGRTYNYTVRTIIASTAPASWTKDISVNSNTARVVIDGIALVATTDQSSRVRLTWPSLGNIKGIETIVLYRDGDELAQISKNVRNYNDSDLIPGMYYRYTLGIIADETNTNYTNWRSSNADGKSLPNGKVSGYIKGKTGAGSEGVVVTATSKTPISDNKTSKIYSYSDTTDASGYYEIQSMFYGNGADYVMTPAMPGYTKKRFDPEVLTRKLVYNDANKQNVDFTDTASLAISGRVVFASIKDSLNNDVYLPLQDAEIWLNGKNSTIRTKADGTYNLGITTSGIQNVQVKYKNHRIDFEGTTDTIKSVFVNNLVNNFNFIDKATDTLTIKVAASCDAPIGEYVTLKLNSEKTGNTNTNGTGNVVKFGKLHHVSSYDWDKGNPKNPGQAKMGEIKMVLPATGFEGQIVQVYENNGINSNKLEYYTKTYNLLKVNMAQRDTVANVKKTTTINTVKADTTYKPDGSIYQITLAKKDTVTKADTTYLAKAPRMDFMYHDKLGLLINNGNPAFADSVKFNPGGIYKYLLAQNDKQLLNIKIRETYSYRGVNYACILDTGDVYVYDAISDIVDRQDFKLDSLTHDVKYTLKIGAPVLEAPYQKTIQIVGKVGSRQTSQIITAVVEGERARNATFVTKTPDIPFFVLHDPPGDNSFATISKGTTITKNFTTSFQYGGGAGAYVDLKVGAGILAPFVGSVGGGVHIQAQVEAGRDNTKGITTSTSMTFTEDFSTSSEETLVGANGDVYVGASMNMVYALTDVLRYDPSKFAMVRDTSLAANLSNFNTTFMYTEYHIKNILLNQLNTLYSVSKNSYDIAFQKYNNGDKSITAKAIDDMRKAYSEYGANIEAWKKALAQNEENRDKASDVTLPPGTNGVVGNNISLSAGAIYDNSITMQKDTTVFSDVNIYLNSEGRLGAFANSGEANEKEIGALFSVRLNWNDSQDSTATKTTTTSYHLEDNDLGDFFSIDLKKDKVYATPVFKIISGSTSCPHEENTQYRHLPAMQISGANEQRNVPSEQAAKFEILISNRSESDETVEYAIKLDPTSNPNGARVLVGGQDVTNGQATYYIPTGKSFKLPVEVFRGPLSSVYENLSLVIFSTCDNTLDDISEANIAKPSVKLNAYFQNKCSEIDLFVPGNNWLVNQSNGNKLYVAFSKYDASGSSPLTSVGLQYRKINQDYENSLWTTVATFPKSVLTDKYYDYTFDVNTLPDGKYEIRAIAVCQGVDVNYSPVYSGTIDRVSAVAFGLPTPANGILTSNEVVGVTFNKDIVYNDSSKPVSITLKRKDNGALIPATVVGDGRSFIIKTIPESAINDYENQELSATIKNLFDVNGNKVADSVSWSFVVNLSPVYWSPTNITVNAIENVQSSFSAKLMNKSALPQNFSIVKSPSWLSPSYKTGKLVALGEQNIDFIIDKNLNTGIYTDTVITMADNKRQLLYITVNVLRTPPTWTVNPADYRYNMSFTTQFSLNQTDTLTSVDIRDKMGVFVGNECRGVANITYDANTKKYVAYITAYSNNAAGESLSVHFWDTYPGLEYQGLERVNFIPNGIVGNANSPLIIHPEGVYQTIPVKKGWNWVSLNVTNADMSVKKVLANLEPSEGDVIKTLSATNSYSQYSKNLGWVGTLDTLSIYKSYMVYSSKSDSIRLLGQLNEQKVDMQLTKGWNWTGYPMAINMELSTYLKNYKPADGSQIVSQEEFAQYNASTDSWSGSLKYLRPGKGYKFYSGADGFTIPVLTYTPVVTVTPPPIVAPIKDGATPVVVNNANTVVNSSVYNNTTVNTTNYENNMSLTSVINQGGQIVNNTTNRYETYVYVENKLVNIVNQTTLSNGQTVGFIPVNGNTSEENKPVTIKVYDKEEKREYTAKVDQSIDQKTDQIVGTVVTPIVLVLDGAADISVSSQISRQTINIGDTLLYSIKSKNIGADLAVNVFLTDTLNQAFEFVSANNGLTYNASKRTLTTSQLQVPAGQESQYQVILKAVKTGNYLIGNGKATVNNDVDLTNNILANHALNVVDKRANVIVSNQLSRSQLNKGEQTTYTLKVKNNGPEVANNVNLLDTIPVGLDYQSSTGGIIYDASTRILSANKAQLKANEEAVFTVVLKASNFGVYQLGKGLISADNDNDVDFNNNKIMPLALTVLDNKVDLVVTTVVSKNNLAKGELLDYTITVKNNGPNVALNINVIDTLAKHFDFVSSGNANYSSSSRTITAEKAQLAPGEEISFVINVKPNAFGNLDIGHGNVTAFNETDYSNNVIKPLYVVVADVRADVNKLVIPGVFTPNGDGVNDLFSIAGLNEFFVQNSLVIYNKSYNVVYKKDNYQNDWNGNNLPMGSYGYILKVVDKAGKEQTYKGYVSIIY